MERKFFRTWMSREAGAVCLLMLLAVVLRFWQLGASAFSSDTLEFYKMALRHQSIFAIWKNPPWLNQIPLNETLTLLFVKAGLPATPFVVRLPFALMGVLALFFIWRFVRGRFGSNAALLVLVLGVFNPYQLYFSRIAYHYSGAVCWSAALFFSFWLIREALQQGMTPAKKHLVLWFLTAALACHMHMSVWVVVGLQGLLLLIAAWKLNAAERGRFYFSFFVGAGLVGALLLRWIIRAVDMSLKGTTQLGASASEEFRRLIPAYFAGENPLALLLLVLFIALSFGALFGKTDDTRRYRTLAWICALHVTALMLYVGLVGGGLAKIAYFSAVWPNLIMLLGIGSCLAVQSLSSKPLRIGLCVVMAGGYVVLTAVPVWAVVHLAGTPTPFYKINDWVLKNLPKGTPVLTDRWLEPWNELAVHNRGGIFYTFTVPDEPLQNYRRFNWPATVEQFYEKYPNAAFLELCPGRYEAELGTWTFPQQYFARVASITNDAAMVMRRFKVFPTEAYSSASTNRVVTRIFYNTTEDLLAAARLKGKDVLRLYGEGWIYTKPGWQKGQFQDYQVMGQAASLDLYNLTNAPLSGTIEIIAAPIQKPKPVNVNGSVTSFAAGVIRTWPVALKLQPGRNPIRFSSPTPDPLLVLDIRWKPAKP